MWRETADSEIQNMEIEIDQEVIEVLTANFRVESLDLSVLNLEWQHEGF